MAAMGELELAEQLRDQAEGAQKMADAIQRSQDAVQILNDNLIIGKTHSNQRRMGERLLGALDAYGTKIEEVDDTTTDFSETAKQLGAQIGNIWANSFQQIADAENELTQAVEEEVMTQMQADEQAAEARKNASREAARASIAAILAEALSQAIPTPSRPQAPVVQLPPSLVLRLPRRRRRWRRLRTLLKDSRVRARRDGHRWSYPRPAWGQPQRKGGRDSIRKDGAVFEHGGSATPHPKKWW